MSILKRAKPEMAYLKCGIYGEAGSGKTFTSSGIAIGLYKHINSKKPIAFADTETGSDFVLPLFEREKIELSVAKTRAFKDLLSIVDEAEKKSSILIIDSVTHFWNELLESYQKKYHLNRITLRHWMPIKQTWREFSDRFVNSKLHIIMAGRSTFIWEDEKDDEGVKEIKKVGTKMRAETEISYEPSLLMEMVKVRISKKAGAKWSHRAHIVKDRFDVIDGQHFDNPEFKEFLPHIQLLNLGGTHRAMDKDRSSEEIFDDKNIGAEKLKKREQIVEKIKNEIYLLYPAQASGSKIKRLELIKEIFGTHSWNEICEMNNQELESGLKALELERNKIKEEKNASTTV